MTDGAPEATPHLAWCDIDQDPAPWDDALPALGLGVFHYSGLLAAHRTGGARRRGVRIEAEGRGAGGLGGLYSDTPNGGRFVTLGFPPRRSALDADLPGRVIAWLAGQGVTEVALGSFDGGVEDYALPQGACPSERLEFPWALPGSADQVRSALRTHHRRKLAKLAGTEFALKVIARAPAWVMTWVQYHWEVRRGGFRPLALWRTHQFHAGLQRHVGRAGLATLYGLYRGRALLTAAYMLEHGDRAFYMLGASAPAGYRVGASVRLFCDLAVRYAGAGTRVLNLGGVPREAEKEGHEEHGVYRFKTAFGVQPAPRRSLLWRAPGGAP